MEIYINDNTIVKDYIFIKNKEYIKCYKCKMFLIDPLICSDCQSIFCKKCLDENNNICQNCKSSNLYNNIFINDILSSLKFKCIKCNNNINYNNIKDHYIKNHYDISLWTLFKNFKKLDLIKIVKKFTYEELISIDKNKILKISSKKIIL